LSIRDFFGPRSIADTFQTSIQAEAPFSGVTSDGLAMTEFTPSVVDFVRLSATASSLGALYRKQWAVRTCVEYLADAVSQLKLKTYQRQDDDTIEYVRDHPLALLLDQPNKDTAGGDLIRDTMSDLLIYGNAYWLKQARGNKMQLFRLPPAFVSPRDGDILSGVGRYTYSNGTANVDFSPEQIVHFHTYHPTDTRVGSPVLEALRLVLNEEYEASRHRAMFWRKGARFSGIIERPADQKWSDAALERFREGWRRFTRSADREEETAVLEDGMTYRPISFSPKDAEFIEGREWALETVATAYHIPLAMLSRKGTMTFASVKEFRRVLYVDVLGSWNDVIERTVQVQLVPDFDTEGLFCEFNIEEKLQGDFEEQANTARQSVQVPWMSVNEMRKIRNLPPVDDPAFDTPAQPSNYLYDGQEPPPQPVQAVPDLSNAAMNGHSDPADPLFAAILEER
jgi:HK97 family phage portal protein